MKNDATLVRYYSTKGFLVIDGATNSEYNEITTDRYDSNSD